MAWCLIRHLHFIYCKQFRTDKKELIFIKKKMVVKRAALNVVMAQVTAWFACDVTPALPGPT
jgi:hypothetical protein